MTRHNHFLNQPAASVEQDSRTLGEENLNRMASLIANAEMPFPLELPPDQISLLAAKVRSLNRKRLVQFVADVIARKILRDRRRDGQLPQEEAIVRCC